MHACGLCANIQRYPERTPLSHCLTYILMVWAHGAKCRVVICTRRQLLSHVSTNKHKLSAAQLNNYGLMGTWCLQYVLISLSTSSYSAYTERGIQQLGAIAIVWYGTRYALRRHGEMSAARQKWAQYTDAFKMNVRLYSLAENKEMVLWLTVRCAKSVSPGQRVGHQPLQSGPVERRIWATELLLHGGVEVHVGGRHLQKQAETVFNFQIYIMPFVI